MNMKIAMLACLTMLVVGLGTVYADHQSDYVTTELDGPFAIGQDVVAACVQAGCHVGYDAELMSTRHYTWLDAGGVGKANTLNNFCMFVGDGGEGGAATSEKRCGQCHAGFDMGNPAVTAGPDCLVCHSSDYIKMKNNFGKAGASLSAAATPQDLIDAAQSVGVPTRGTCLRCHASAGGGNNVKKGDMRASFASTTHEYDVHMGTDGENFACQECHITTDHQIPGDSVHMVDSDEEGVVTCESCHYDDSHAAIKAELDTHADFIACQTCHIPAFSREGYTKMSWDWSTAGTMTLDGNPPTLANCNPSDMTKSYQIIDPVTGQQIYACGKGTFTWGTSVTPTYAWWNGDANRYMLGDAITSNPVVLASPQGSKGNGKIYPFKVMEGTQPADTANNIMGAPWIQPGAVGAYWHTYDWNLALTSGAATAGIPYSGTNGWQDTQMYMLTTHEVAPASDALDCDDCHSDTGVLDFAALGYTEPEQDHLVTLYDQSDMGDAGMTSTSDVPALPAIGIMILGGSLAALAARKMRKD